jgi:RNA polymerase sigma-70 factor (ECF subfamily)
MRSVGSEFDGSAPAGRRAPDSQSLAWLAALTGPRGQRDAALGRLHALLLRAALFEIDRRVDASGRAREADLDDLALQAANDALLAIVGRLDTYRGGSRFTTWACKFASFEVGARLRRREWQGRELPHEADGWADLAGRRASPDTEPETAELIAAVTDAIAGELTERERGVLIALTVNDVPIDVLAERLGTTRGAVYQTLHDARAKLRARVDGSLRRVGTGAHCARRGAH